MYRHFASKDDLVLAIADALIEEATAGVSLQDCWVDTLAESARRLRRTYLAHPAAAALSACRTTQRPAEMRIVNVIIGAVRAAGFEGAEAAVVYRALGDFSLYWSGGEAAFWALDEKAQQTDRAALDPGLPGRGRGRVPAHLRGPRRAAEGRRRRHLRDDPVAGPGRADAAGPAPVCLRDPSVKVSEYTDPGAVALAAPPRRVRGADVGIRPAR